MPNTHSKVEAAIKAFAKGELVVVTDDDDRENEGDLFVAASLCTPEKMAFIIRHTSGIVCAPLGAEHATRLHLDPMVAKNDKYETPTAKIQVCLSGNDSAMTLLKFKHGDVVEKGSGWEYLKGFAKLENNRRNAFTGAEAKVLVKLRAYKTTDKNGKVRAGISMAATQLFIKPKARLIIEEADVLEDW